MRWQVTMALLGVAVLVMAPNPAYRLQAAGDNERVPLLQGAFPVSNGEANAGTVRRAYAVSKPTEVAEIERSRLGAAPVPSAEELTIRDGNAREQLQPGSVSPVWMLAKSRDFPQTDRWSPPNPSSPELEAMQQMWAPEALKQ